MVGIDTIISVVLFLLGIGLIFGLLHYLITYVESKFPSVAPFAGFAHIFLVIAGIFMLIGVILDFLGHPIVRWR